MEGTVNCAEQSVVEGVRVFALLGEGSVDGVIEGIVASWRWLLAVFPAALVGDRLLVVYWGNHCLCRCRFCPGVVPWSLGGR